MEFPRETKIIMASQNGVTIFRRTILKNDSLEHEPCASGPFVDPEMFFPKMLVTFPRVVGLSTTSLDTPEPILDAMPVMSQRT